MNSEEMSFFVRKMHDAAERACFAADRIEAAVHRIGMLLEDGYGGNGSRLIEALESLGKRESNNTVDLSEAIKRVGVT